MGELDDGSRLSHVASDPGNTSSMNFSKTTSGGEFGSSLKMPLVGKLAGGIEAPLSKPEDADIYSNLDKAEQKDDFKDYVRAIDRLEPQSAGLRR